MSQSTVTLTSEFEPDLPARSLTPRRGGKSGTSMRPIKTSAKEASSAHDDKVRVTVRMHKALTEEIDSLVERTDAHSAPEVIRNAITYYATLVSEAEKGNDVVVIEPDGTRTKYPILMRTRRHR